MEKGLSTKQANELQKTHGQNLIHTTQSFSPLKLFFSQFVSVLNAILLAAAILSFFLHDYIEAFFIFAIILLDSIFGFSQEYKAEKSLEKLKHYTSHTVRVIRDGKESQIPAEDLVPGDIVILSEGERIPADGALLLTRHVEIDESILTGESLPVTKSTSEEVFMGTLITKGHGEMKVTTIGMQTKFGQIAQTLSDIQSEKTPLQKQLTGLGKTLSLLALLLVFLLLLVGIAQGRELTFIFLLAVSLGVAAIPEGLPAVITAALAIGTNRMAKKKAIVRHMASVETLGSVQIILVDKTGTLTQNKMQVKTYWLPDTRQLSSLLRCCILGNTASFVQNPDTGMQETVGDQTDAALLHFAKDKDYQLSNKSPHGKIIDEFVFDATTKLVTTIWQEGTYQEAYVRGAPESVIEKSTLSAKDKEKITSRLHDYAQQGLRVIAFATRKNSDGSLTSREQWEKDLTFLGLVGIYDPPRPEVKEALRQAKKAGIRTIMVTGDNEITAIAISKEIGLIEKEEHVITGKMLATMSDEELLPLLPKVQIFARSQPQDKLRIATLLQQQGFVVGVSGDGVNDALALKKANVGVAMGATGTDVAKEASDIIITDDNFATIVTAVEEGRTIYHNIVKAITYLVSGNIAELSLVFLATLFGLPTPLLPTHILWINLITDGMPALALASDKKDPSVLEAPPRDPHLPILHKKRLLFITSLGLGLALVLLVLFIYLLQRTDEAIARSLTFNLLAILHLGIVFVVRGRNAFRPHKLLILTLLSTILLQVIINILPVTREIFAIALPF